MRAKQRRIFNSILAVVVLFGLAGFYSSQGLAWQDLLPLKSSVTHGAAAQTPVGGYGVSAAHPLAVEAGMEILERGGNAVDAAVAVSYVLAVVEPYASGIGGGGAALVFPAGSTRPQVYDYREAAPLRPDARQFRRGARVRGRDGPDAPGTRPPGDGRSA